MDGTAEARILLSVSHRVVALDGRDLSGPRELGPQRLRLGMGLRADREFRMPSGPSAGAVGLVDSRLSGRPSAVQSLFGAPSHAGEPVTFGAGPAPAAIDSAATPVFDPLTYRTPAPRPDDGAAT